MGFAWRAVKLLASFGLSVSAAAPAWAADFTVTNSADSGAGSLRQAIIDLNTSGGASNNIIISSGVGTITLTGGDLQTVARNVTIVGNGNTLSGNSQFRGLFIGAFSGTTQTTVSVSVSDLTIANTRAQGGNASSAPGSGSGGGGAGLGGALFVANNATLTVSNVTLASNSAAGGAGGQSGTAGGGGGGMGGDGGTTVGGGGGLGVGATGGNNASSGQGGIATGGSSGGAAGNPGATGAGASGGGGGGNNTGGGGGGAAGGGGVGGGTGGNLGAGTATGGAGGFGGGGGAGGGGGGNTGGAGGFGGGGGSSSNGGVGGFGGGGGGGGLSGGTGGFGGGNGGGGGIAGGGGGAGLGGAVFVQQGGTLNIAGAFNVNGGTVTAGASGGGAGGATAGSAFGTGMFLQGNGTINFTPGTGQSQTVSDVIADQTGSGGTGGNAGSYGIVKEGAGTTTLSALNTYTGGTTINAGTVSIAANNNLGAASGGLTFGGGTLQTTATFTTGRVVTLNAGGGTFGTATGTTLTATGVIGGAGGLAKTGTGTLTLEAVNTYIGATTINAGTLALSAAGDISASSGVTVGTGATFRVGDGVAALIASLAGSGAVAIGSTDPTSILLLTGTTSSPATIFSGTFAGPGSLELDDSAHLTLSGIGTDHGTIGGDLELCNCLTGGLTLDGGQLTVQGQFEGVSVFGGTLAVINGGTLQIGPPAGSNADLMVAGTLNITGPGSTVTTTGFTGVGIFDAGTLAVSGGGVLNSQQGAEVDALFGAASATVDGAGSAWNIGGLGLSVGGGTTGGIGQLSISNGGVVNVTSGDVVIGDEVDGSSLLRVSGAGSTLNVTSGQLLIGDVGCGCGPLIGTLAIDDGAVVTATGGTVIDTGNALRLGNGGAGGTLITPTIANAGGIIADFTDGITLAADISGSGTLFKAGAGTLILSGTNSYTGGTSVVGGVLQGTTSSLQGNILNNAAVVFDQATNGTYAGVMSGSGSLAKSGTGSVVLSGANTYIGGTTVNGGLLQLASGASLASGGALTINGGTFDLNGNNQTVGALSGTGGAIDLGSGTLTTNSTANTTFAGSIGGAGGLVKQGSGTLTLTGTNSYTGGTTVSAGVLQGSSASLQGNIVNNAAVVFDQTAAGTYAGGMSGTGALTKTGAGTLVMTGTNSYSGGTTVSAGTLQGNTASLRGNIVNNANVTFAETTGGTYSGDMSGIGSLTKTGGAILTLSGTSTYTGGTTVSGGVLVGYTSSLQGNIVNNAQVNFNAVGASTYAGNMSGAGVLVTSGQLTLTGTNTYSGGTVVNAGTLQGSTTSLQGNITFSGGNAIHFAQNTAGTFAGVISNGGSVEKSGTGTVTFTGNNTYLGITTISGGTLQIGNGGTTGSLGFGEVRNFSALTFNLSGPSTVSNSIIGFGTLNKQGAGTLSLLGTNSYTGGTTVSGGILQGNSSSLQGAIVNNSAVIFEQLQNGTYSGAMSGGGSLTKSGTGTVTLTGTNSHTGGTTISGGILQIGNGGISGSIAGDVLNNATLAFNRSDTVTFGGLISGSGALDKLGAGTLILTADNTYSGVTTIAAGTLQLGNGGTTGSILGDVLNNGVLAFNRSDNIVFGGNIDGSGAIAYMGPGTVTLTGTVSNTGGAVVAGGIVQAASDAALGAAGATLTFAGGTLQATGGFTLDRPLSLIAGGGTIDTAGNSLTVGGNIVGAGGLTKTGTGTLILSGTNSYTGGTTVSAGVLQGSSASLQGNIANNAAVVFDQVAPGTFAGNISGIGSLTKTGIGALTLTGTNSYGGGTTVSAGILRGNSSSLQGSIQNNAAVIFDQAANGTYAGAMSGTGSLTKTGVGTLILTGTNSYTGSTTVNAGTLRGNSASLQGNIVNDAAVIFDQVSNGTYAGNMTGTGTLAKAGAGTLILTGTNAVGGGTTVNAGQLVVNGSLTGGVTVAPGAILGGSGQIVGPFTANGGTVMPGNSIGTLTVNGSFTQTGGVYQVEVNPAGQSDLIAVTGAPGTATIGGGATVQVLAEAGTYRRSTTYTILSATGGVIGTYTGVTSNFAFLTPTLSYGANNVFLTLVQSASAFASGAQTSNQYAVGTALDIASPTASGDFATVLNALAGLNTQQGPAALNAISGQPYTGFGTANVASGLLFMNTLGQQIAGARGGSAATRVALAEACAVACDEGGEPARWGAWISGMGGLGSVGGNSNAGTFTYNFGGTAFGIDYRLDPKLVVGAAAGYTSGQQWVGGFQGNGSASNYSTALYASFASGGFYADGLAGYAYADNQMQRVLQIPGLAQRIASGRTGANQFLGQVEAGYRIGIFAPAALSASPFARLQTVAVSQNGFTESGANALNLGVAQQNTTSVRTVLGSDLVANIPIGSERLLGVAVRLGWAHEYAQTARPMTASFAGAPAVPFAVYGAQPLRDAAVIGFGLNTRVAEQTSIYARYDGELNGRDDAHAFSAGFRMTW